MSEENLFWLSTKRFVLIGIFLLLIFIGFLVFFYLKADEITKDPCGICAEYLGERVTCRVGETYFVEKYYLPNGTVTDNMKEAIVQASKDQYPPINKSIVKGFID